MPLRNDFEDITPMGADVHAQHHNDLADGVNVASSVEILSGVGPPSDLLGAGGDFYADTEARLLYGPRGAGDPVAYVTGGDIGTNGVIPKGSAAVGDVIIVSYSGAASMPADFTATSGLRTGQQAVGGYKVVDGDDPSSWTMTGLAGDGSGVYAVYRNAVVVEDVSANQSASTSVVALDLLKRYLIVHAWVGTGNFGGIVTPPGTITTRHSTSSSFRGGSIGDEVQDGTGNTIARTATGAGTDFPSAAVYTLRSGVAAGGSLWGDAVDYLKESDYNANTILAATADNTPVALTVAASRIIGRKASGDISALTAAEAATLLALAISDITGLQGALDAKAPLASPVFTGNPTAPTPSAADNDTSVATTAFVQGEITAKAPLASPTFTGTPAAPTATQGTNTTQIATTAYVQTEAGLLVPKSLYDANTILAATSDDTPVALTVNASTFVGRKASGDIAAMSASEAKTVLAIAAADVTDFSEAVDDRAGSLVIAGRGAIPTYDDSAGSLRVDSSVWTPEDQGYLAWTFDPTLAPSGLATTASRIYITRVPWRKTQNITTLHAWVVTAGASLTSGGNSMGVYSSSGTRLGVTADITAEPLGVLSANLTGGPISVTGGPTTHIYLACKFQATTQPVMLRLPAGATGAPSVNLASSAIRVGFLAGTSGQLLPSSITISSFTVDSNSMWMAAL